MIIPNAILCWLVAPSMAYLVFNEKNKLAKLWETYMPIRSNEYFEFALPATLMFIFGMRLIRNNVSKSSSHQILIDNLKKYVYPKGNISIIMIVFGLIATVLYRITPSAIQQVMYSFSFMTYVGTYYAYYSNFKYKKTVISLAVFITLLQSVITGMYGELVYISAITSIIILVGTRITVVTKTLIATFGVLAILLIQSIKTEYRDKTWRGTERSADAGYFFHLLQQRLTNPSQIFEPDRLFNIAVRINQGQIVARAMDYVPKKTDFANGETILKVVPSLFIPRLFWADKPKTGGADNVCRFLGDCTSILYGMSYNISPLGEAYVNFGKIGGIVFMFFYGLLLGYLFNQCLRIALKIPTIVLWLPFLFITVVVVETDILTQLNNFVKSAFFVWFIFKFFAIVFRLKL